MRCCGSIPSTCNNYFFGDAGCCCREQMENRWLVEVGRSGFAWKMEIHVKDCWPLLFMDVGVVFTPSKTRSASVLSVFFLLPPHPKSRRPWLSLCRLRSLVVCGLLSPAWEPAGKSNQGCRKG